MKYTYKTKGTCSSQIQFDYDNGAVSHVEFTGGCNGNLKAIAALVEGNTPEQIKEKLRGITCGRKSTSCADQLAEAVMKAKENKV